MRNKNKIALLKEFNLSRIKTNFVESTLFKDENNIKICGSLDSFYEAPLLFANLSNDIYASGIDILFNTIIKLFDLNKNIQVIIAIKNGLDKGFIRKWVDFLSQKTDLSGRWVFINSEINLSKFLAASDMLLLPNRINYKTSIHYLGMNYGSVPIANKIGIFDDSIIDIFDDISKGCGFKTKTNFIKEDVANDLFFNTVIKSLQMYYNNPNSWNLLIKNCLNQDSSWDFETLEKYNQIYKKLS